MSILAFFFFFLLLSGTLPYPWTLILQESKWILSFNVIFKLECDSKTKDFFSFYFLTVGIILLILYYLSNVLHFNRWSLFFSFSLFLVYFFKNIFLILKMKKPSLFLLFIASPELNKKQFQRLSCSLPILTTLPNSTGSCSP